MSRVTELFTTQRSFFRSHQTIPWETRKEALLALSRSIQMHEKEVLEALQADLGKDTDESYLTEIGQVYSEIRTQLRHLKSWSSQKWALPSLSAFPGISSTQKIPYGNVLIISPWNYPFALTLVPLVDALAAGNTAVLKPSNYSTHVSAVVDKIISQAFNEEYVAVCLGGHEVTTELLEQDFDFIFFTGSERVGKIVMEKAASTLAPVVLELGGKSPCIVDEDCNLAMAARRIVWGKLVNAGQTCVAPDYVLVHESVAEPFVRLVKREIEKQCPNPANIGKIITKRHFDRLITLLQDVPIVSGGRASEETLQIEPTVIYPATPDMKVMEEEIFGPILPILVYGDFYALMNRLQTMPTPLSCYLFTRDPLKKEYWRNVLPFGGGCINDVILQVSDDHIPFGGMKQSGMGQYHGKYGFNTFSHTKGMIEKAEFDLPIRIPGLNPELRSFIIRTIFRAPH